MSPNVQSVRQNLSLVVDQGRAGEEPERRLHIHLGRRPTETPSWLGVRRSASPRTAPCSSEPATVFQRSRWPTS